MRCAIFSARLGDWLDVRGKSKLFERIIENTTDLMFVTAMARLVANVLVLLCMLRVFETAERSWYLHYLLATAVAVVITLFCSVAIPHAAAQHASEAIIGTFAGFLLAIRVAFYPVTKVMHAIDTAVGKMAGADQHDRATADRAGDSGCGRRRGRKKASSISRNGT